MTSLYRSILLVLMLLVVPISAAAKSAVILVYHRFGPTVADSMTTRTETFRSQLSALRQDGFQFVPLAQVVAGLTAKGELPEKAVTITIDDGHRTVYTEVLPIIRQQRLPVTLFIYPSAISNASYAMTWEEIREMQDTGLVSIGSHTYWHPNFKTEKRRLAADAYASLVTGQLSNSRATLKRRLGVETDLLAWPFGITDPELQAAAAKAGYRAALALGERKATDQDPALALPRFLIVDAVGVKGLLNRVHQGVTHDR